MPLAKFPLVKFSILKIIIQSNLNGIKITVFDFNEVEL